MSCQTIQTRHKKLPCIVSPLASTLGRSAIHDGKAAEDGGQRSRFTLLCSASRHFMLWQRISLQLVLQELKKNAPRELPDQASSLPRWLKVCKSWLPVKGWGQRQQQACKSPFNQAGGGDKRQSRRMYGECLSQACKHLISFHTKSLKKLSGQVRC